ncbi:GH92 family glycosyl hydrolase [Flavobacterium chungbukense]|uniref:GH92 family glycosyl hydrolase n=1 Tax=Flavobacterium chungbukense TaxID=877464 RepID=A0ABP7YGT2_9FLAO|nr:GH92 family glycosyl hydrolase [Flavobacterium chungbukense]MCC4920324.1 GH92 family glycosyl hydrolase [Flavobacterium chungbukense]
MNIKNSIVFALFTFAFVSAQNTQVITPQQPIDWVNPLIGSDSDYGISNGNTYPAIAMPWGMNFWTPQTGNMGDGWAYTYKSNRIKGFKQTHQPSPWMNDYGQFSIMPVTGELKFKEEERQSWFSHKAETVTPYYYSVYLADHNVTTEITPTERAARFRFTFPETDRAYIVIDAFDKGSYVKIIPSERKIIGYTTKNSGGVPENFKNYFVIIFDKDFQLNSTFNGAVLGNALEMKADHAGAVIGFKTKTGEKVNAQVASSFISYKQAELNLKEIGTNNFDQLKEKGKNIWNKELGRIKVDGGTPDQIGTFYSCLYRSLLFPRKFYEYDKNNKVVHYSPYNGKLLSGYMFVDTGFWDTFRALYPFLNLMYPELNTQMQEALSNAFNESGWLPEWSSPGLRDIMVGNNSASIVSEAYLKSGKVKSYDIENLYKALIHGANNAGPMKAVGRAAADSYNALGYVPNDEVNESAARTLEYAYDDFAIYQLAKALKKPQSEIDLYKKRSLNYKNLFDPKYNLMHPKNKDGKFMEPFDPFQWFNGFTEGNSWHYSWSVFHDVQGLVDLMGGKNVFISQLDKVFSSPPVFATKDFKGGVIHEMREMQIANMGQYAHGNQPIQHMIYLYNYAGEPWKAQYWVRETMNRMYHATPDGYCGDEDNGQTSAWYVFSSLGFYPVTPASDQYVIGAPLFKKVTIELENGKNITINASQNSDQNRYIRGLKFNGKAYNKNWLSHSELMKGATLDFDMSSTSNTKRGINKEDFPYSLSNE